MFNYPSAITLQETKLRKPGSIKLNKCKIGQNKIRIINGYGPQEDDPLNTRVLFWSSLEQELVPAKNENCMVLIQVDGNAKLGKQVISQDTHVMTENGRLLFNIIERESLVLLNTSQLCQGVVTRHWVAKEKVEQSILDYILTCDELGLFMEEMLIDDKRNFSLPKYATTKGVKKIVQSDHNIMYGNFLIEYRNLIWTKPRK